MLIDDAIAMRDMTPTAVKTLPFLAPDEPAVTFTTWDELSPLERQGYTIIPDGRELVPAILAANKVFDLTRGVVDAAVATLERGLRHIDAAASSFLLPAPRTIIEWSEKERWQCKEAAGLQQALPAGSFIPARIGVYLEATDQSLQRGCFRLFWSSTWKGGVEISPLIGAFDFTNPDLHRVGPLSLKPLADAPLLTGCHRYDVAPEFRALAGDVNYIASYPTVQQALGDMVGEWNFIVAVLGLFLAHNALNLEEQGEQELARENAARKRRNKVPKRSRTTVKMSLTEPTQSNKRRRPGETHTGGRASPHLHYVRGHQYVRNGHIYWRGGHYRGSAKGVGTTGPTRTRVTL